MRLVPWLVTGELVNGQVINRKVDFDRYEERLGFRPTGNPEFSGRWLLLTDEGELKNVSTQDADADWGGGRIVG